VIVQDQEIKLGTGLVGSGNTQVKETNSMIKLKSLIPEAYADVYGKNQWIQLKKDEVRAYSDEIISLIVGAYATKGGNYEFANAEDIKKSDLDFWVANDIDVDPEIDSVLGGKTTPAGTKMTVMGQDGSGTAKRVGITRMIELMKTRGFYAELDKDLATKLSLPMIEDEATIRKVINKDLKMNPDGSYDRQITGGPVKTKVLVGIPKV